MDKFTVIVKRSSLTKLDNLIKDGKAKVVKIDALENEWSQLVILDDGLQSYIFPYAYGYGGRNDGYVIPNIADKSVFIEGMKIASHLISNFKGEKSIILQIDETR